MERAKGTKWRPTNTSVAKRFQRKNKIYKKLLDLAETCSLDIDTVASNLDTKNNNEKKWSLDKIEKNMGKVDDFFAVESHEDEI